MSVTTEDTSRRLVLHHHGDGLLTVLPYMVGVERVHKLSVTAVTRFI